MRYNNGESMKIRVGVSELLTKLKTNKANHSVVVKEAREGYIEKARAALNDKLDALATGKCVHLSFNLLLPEEHFDEYDTAIAMCEWAKDEDIELDAEQFRNFIQDQWGWSGSFYQNNAAYSVRAAGAVR